MTEKVVSTKDTKATYAKPIAKVVNFTSDDVLSPAESGYTTYRDYFTLSDNFFEA